MFILFQWLKKRKKENLKGLSEDRKKENLNKMGLSKKVIHIFSATL